MRSLQSFALLVALCALSSPVSGWRRRPGTYVIHYVKQEQGAGVASSSSVAPVDTSVPVIEDTTNVPIQGSVQRVANNEVNLNDVNLNAASSAAAADLSLPTGSSSSGSTERLVDSTTTTTTGGNIECGPLTGTLTKFTLGGSGFAWRAENGKGYCSGGSKCTEGNAGDNMCGTGATSCCIGASGAVFVSADQAGTYFGSTKIECSTDGGGKSWCNISLVDGFSVPAFCAPPGGCIEGRTGTGGKGMVNLLDKGACPAGLNKQGNCPNPASQSDSAPDFFTKDGPYWINVNHASDSLCTFDATKTASCMAGKGSTSSKMMARELGEVEEVAVLEKREAHAHRRHGRVHAKAVS